MTTDLEETFDCNLERYLQEWKEFVSFASVSADSGHHQDCLDCADWLVGHLEGMGLESRLLQTSSKPAVFAERTGSPEHPVILLYGHYDVQPVDPVEQWDTPPFEPTLKDGRLYGRGAQDNKGQLLCALKALETVITEGDLESTVKVIIEGEEECGSPGLEDSVRAWGDLLKADILMVNDTNSAASGAPAITMGLRGIIHLTLELSGAETDLHSGAHGGKAPNPATGIARMLATLHRADGSIAVEGYYDSVTPPSSAESSAANAVTFDMEAYLKETGVPAVGGEHGYTPPERTGFRPAIDVNGIHTGYGGDGIKTIIPSRATAKITARLVEGQDPGWCLDAIIRHLEQNTPQGLTMAISEKGIGGAGFRLNVDSALVATARGVLAETSSMEAELTWEGGSIPIVAVLSEVTGAEPLMVGFGRDEDRIHAPNESFSIKQFRQGYRYVATMLARM